MYTRPCEVYWKKSARCLQWKVCQNSVKPSRYARVIEKRFPEQEIHSFFILKLNCCPFSDLEFKEYIITRSQKVGTNYKYAVRVNDPDSNDPPKIFLLEGGSEKKDPLKEYRTLELLVTRVDDNKLFITGIRNGQDCVLKITEPKIWTDVNSLARRLCSCNIIAR